MIQIEMEMPKRCGECRFASAFDCLVNGIFITDHNERTEHCPLQERSHGEWIFKNGKYRCMVCGEKAIYVYPGLSTSPKAILTDFCPHCGVQMNAKALERIRKREGSGEE